MITVFATLGIEFDFNLPCGFWIRTHFLKFVLKLYPPNQFSGYASGIRRLSVSDSNNTKTKKKTGRNYDI